MPDQIIRGAWFYDLKSGLLGRRGRRLWATVADGLDPARGDRVLDVGCGPGRLAQVLAGRVAPTGSVVGIDASEEMIRRARTKRGGDRIEFRVAQAQALPFADAEFDALACTLVFHHVAESDRADAMREMHRVLKPGGRIVVAEFTPGQRPWSHQFGRRRHGAGHHHGQQHGQQHGHDHDSLAEAEHLAAQAGFTDLSTGATPVRWAARLTGRKP